VGWLIQTIGRDTWAHAALYTGSGNVIEAKGSGVRKTTLAEVLHLNSLFTLKYRIYRLRNNNPEVIQKVINYCEERLGWEYDYGSVGFIAVVKILERFGIVQQTPLINPLNSKEKIFCSELVGESFSFAGEALFEADTALTKTSDIAGSKKLFQLV